MSQSLRKSGRLFLRVFHFDIDDNLTRRNPFVNQVVCFVISANPWDYLVLSDYCRNPFVNQVVCFTRLKRVHIAKVIMCRNPFVNQVVCFIDVILSNMALSCSRNPFVNQVVCFTLRQRHE